MSLLDQGAAMDALLTALSEGATLKEACTAANVSPAAHYHWLKSDKAYQEGFELAKRLRNHVAEDAFERRAIDGYKETKTTFTILPDGTRMAVEEVVVHKFDNGALARMLAANVERYNPKIKAEITHTTSVAEILAGARRRLERAEDGNEEED